MRRLLYKTKKDDNEQWIFMASEGMVMALDSVLQTMQKMQPDWIFRIVDEEEWQNIHKKQTEENFKWLSA